MSIETIQCPNAGRRVMTILALGLLFTMLAGCPPHNPTPVAADEESEHETLTRKT